MCPWGFDSDGLPLFVVYLRYVLHCSPFAAGFQPGGGENGGLMARTKQIRLYWVTTADHDEDWFIFAESAKNARAYHEDYEGYDKGAANSRLIVSNVTLKEFMNGTPPCHARFQDLFQIGFQNARTTSNRRGVKFSGEIFREGILEAIIELGRKQLASEAASSTAELDGVETGPRLVH